AAEVPRAQPGRERLAVHARQLALQPHLQILRRSRRPLLCGMEQARRSALAHHVHRTAPMGPRVLINGIWYKRIACIVDGYIVDRGDTDVSAARSHARAVSGVDSVKAACAGGDPDVDTRLQLQIDGVGKAVEKEGCIYVDAAGIRVAARRADSVAGRTRALR